LSTASHSRWASFKALSGVIKAEPKAVRMADSGCGKGRDNTASRRRRAVTKLWP
jgi:tripartite-type tricarboxylate transporter receptor subunit TctC